MAADDTVQRTPSRAPAPQATPASETPAPRNGRRKRRFFLILLGVVVLVLLAAFLWWLHARNYESTDDAFIDAHIVHVSPQITGRVQQVQVTDNVAVKTGQLLVQIDSADERAQLDQAEAQVRQIQAQQAQANTQVQVAQAALARARADRMAIAAQETNAASQLRRYEGLRKSYPAAVSNQQIDEARAAAANLAAQEQAAARQIDSAREQIAAARSQVASAQAALGTAQAQLQQAQLNLGYTQLRAPLDGTVADLSVAVGDYVQPGQQLLDIVPHTIWVTANFKETQLTLMRPGQRADMTIDAYPSVDFVGHVDSIQRGAGQAFAVLPAQNATGNFVKVVQRVPVKIVIDSPDPAHYVLGPGMSVNVTVHVR